MLIWTTQIQ